MTNEAARFAVRGAPLDGPWSFWPDLEGRLPAGPGAGFVPMRTRDELLGSARTAHVPGAWQAQFDDLRLWAGAAWYERDLMMPAEWRGGRVRLVFGAVDYFANVWVNGRFAGEHEGGYLPFAVDVAHLVRFDAPNTVTLEVLDVGVGDEGGPFPFSEIPHGKQSWYGPIGGPWQPVRVEARGQVLLDRVRIETDIESGNVTATIQLDGATHQDDDILWWIVAPNGSVIASGDVDPGDATIRTRVTDALTWDVGVPNLYRLDIEVHRGGFPIDHVGDRFGFRTIGVTDGRVTLNGRPVYLLGALDQDYWFPGISTPADDNEIDAQMQRARELGLNLLRCHIKPPDPRYLDAADRTGLLVWCEPPNCARLSEPAKGRLRDTLAGMVDRDWNHPSLAIRSIVNEDWGTDLPTNHEHRDWLRETYRWVRSMDRSRLVVDNSACPPNFHVESDLNDFHVYRAVPEQAEEWREWTKAWVRDPSATYSPHGDAILTASEPLVLSEFGIWGLPDTEGLLDDHGLEPWWFDTGKDHSDGIFHPAGVRERFDAWGLEEVFGSWGGFVRESQEHEFEGLKLQIEDLRSHGAIAGYVITELTDVHWEANGLLDMRRHPKVFHDRFASLNAQNVILVRPERNRYLAGERVRVDIRAVGPAGPIEGRVGWELEGFGVHGEAQSNDLIEFEIPSLDRPVRATLAARWVDTSGERVDRNTVPLWLAPSHGAGRDPNVDVARRWGDVADHVASGGRAVIVIGESDSLPEGAPIAMEGFGSKGRSSGQAIYGNGWLLSTGMGWLSPRLVEGLALGPRVDLAFEGVTPRSVLTGYRTDARRDVLAGHFLGWLHHMRATVAGFTHGEGAGILCTFPLLEHDGADPLATRLLDRLTMIAGSPGFAPGTEI